jgi:hypothetical protein
MHTSRIISLMFSTNCCSAAGRVASSGLSWSLDHSRSLTVRWTSSAISWNSARKVKVSLCLLIFTNLSHLVTHTYAVEWQSLLTWTEELNSRLLSNCVLYHGTCLGRLEHSRSLGIAFVRSRVWSRDLHNKKYICYPLDGNVITLGHCR